MPVRCSAIFKLPFFTTLVAWCTNISCFLWRESRKKCSHFLKLVIMGFFKFCSYFDFKTKLYFTLSFIKNRLLGRPSYCATLYHLCCLNYPKSYIINHFTTKFHLFWSLCDCPKLYHCQNSTYCKKWIF